jgi:hypothetical protein
MAKAAFDPAAPHWRREHEDHAPVPLLRLVGTPFWIKQVNGFGDNGGPMYFLHRRAAPTYSAAFDHLYLAEVGDLDLAKRLLVAIAAGLGGRWQDLDNKALVRARKRACLRSPWPARITTRCNLGRVDVVRRTWVEADQTFKEDLIAESVSEAEAITVLEGLHQDD